MTLTEFIESNLFETNYLTLAAYEILIILLILIAAAFGTCT